MSNPFSAPATITSSASSRGGRRSEEVRRRSGGGNTPLPPPPPYRGEGVEVGGEPTPTLFALPTTAPTGTTKPRRREPLNAWAHTTTTGQCPTCGKPTLNALENTDIPIHNTTDPRTLTSHQELTTLLAGRHTYDYDTRARTLRRRTIYQIRGQPPEHGPHPVLPEHHCTNQTGTPLPPRPRTKETSTNDQAPF